MLLHSKIKIGKNVIEYLILMVKHDIKILMRIRIKKG